MRTAAGLSPGETVLVQGATGVAGRLAVRIARLLGAGRIVATGRNDDALHELAALGADVVINTAVEDADLVKAFRDNAGEGYDVVIDYLWGRPTELLTRSLIPESFTMPKGTRLVQIGESAGPAIQLTGDVLRNSGLEIYGAARNMATGIADAYQQVIDWVRSGELTIDVTTMPLSQIEKAWARTDLRGTRLVVVAD
jgi:NADPH2:quinone reductase